MPAVVLNFGETMRESDKNPALRELTLQNPKVSSVGCKGKVIPEPCGRFWLDLLGSLGWGTGGQVIVICLTVSDSGLLFGDHTPLPVELVF